MSKRATSNNSDKTLINDPCAEQPSPPGLVSRQARAAKLANTMANKLLKTTPDNNQGSGSSQPSNDIPNHIMLPLGSVRKPSKGANWVNKKLKSLHDNGQLSANDTGFIILPKGSASKSTINNPRGSTAKSKSITSNDPQKVHHVLLRSARKQAKVISNNKLKSPPGNSQEDLRMTPGV